MIIESNRGGGQSAKVGRNASGRCGRSWTSLRGTADQSKGVRWHSSMCHGELEWNAQWMAIVASSSMHA